MIVLYCDNKYLKWLTPLAKSIKKWEPNERILLFAINYDPDGLIKDNKTIVLFDNNSIRYVSIIADRKELPFHIIEGKAGYLLQAFDEFPKEDLYIMMDIDMLLLKSLKEVKRAVMKYKFDMAAVLANPDKICGGFYIFRRTKLNYKMLTVWNNYLMDGNFFFDKDQGSLAQLVRTYMFEKGLKFLPLPRMYLDHFSKKDSIIWSAHKSEFGNKDQRYKLYMKEVKKW